MANSKHLNRLQKGVLSWNAWRRAAPGLRPDLSGADLAELDLQGIHLEYADLSGANLRSTDLFGARLRHALLVDADLMGVDLRTASLAGADLRYARLAHAVLTGGNLQGASLRRANLGHADLRGADLTATILTHADLSHATLIGANLTTANLSGADVSDAVLIQADLTDANLVAANLRGAKLRGVTLSRADLAGANLTAADLTLANLTAASLVGATLTAATLTRAQVGRTRFVGLDLAGVYDLDSLSHLGPSYLDISTLYNSRGRISDLFLRGIGAPDEVINLAHGIAASQAAHRACFISYSTADQLFTERLHTDLQAGNVRCWTICAEEPKRRADHGEVVGGESLLVILSVDSITSPGMEDEMERVFERKRREGAQAIFLIAIDNAVWNSDKAWVVNLRNSHPIGHFEAWRDDVAYQAALQRLLCNLKAAHLPTSNV